MNKYSVLLEKFEGPLDLLLELIEKEKLDINEISLAKVTDQFLEYLKKLGKAEAAILADFLVVAARLILIKSRTLLPSLKISEEEEEGIEELKARLLEYQRLKHASVLLGEIDKKRQESFARESFTRSESVFYPPQSLSVSDLRKAMNKVIALMPSKEILETKILNKIASVEEKIKEISKRLEKGLASFSSIAKDSESKIDLIISFLALLELVKQRVISVKQSGESNDIEIKRRPA